MTSFSQNIEAIWAESSEIAAISSTDFAPFKKLRQIHLYGNKIEVLNADLFASNPLIQHMSFGANPLKHIATGVFDHLEDLRSLYFENSNCVTKSSATNNRAEVLKLIELLVIECPPSAEMIIKEFLESFDLKMKIEQEVMEKVSPLTWKLFQLEQKVETQFEKCNCNKS